MASSNASERPDSGYATAAFGVMALGMSLIAAAVMARAVGELRSARVALLETERAAQLDSALTLAADGLMREAGTAAASWNISLDGQTISLAAEPEGGKLSVAAAPAKELITSLTGGKQVDAALVEAAPSLAAARDRLAGLSSSPEWKLCASSLFSPLSRNEGLSMRPPVRLTGGAINWRVGEVWRLVAVDASGHGVDALVRFTGRPEAPMAMLDRRTGFMTPPDLARCLAYADRKPGP